MDHYQDSFTSLCALQLPSPCRLLAASCCPDKDLVVLVSRIAGQDRLSLWKIHGTKIWETELDSDLQEPRDIPAVAWSPDGQTIAVAFNPPRISVRSIQDGTEEHMISFPTLGSMKLTTLRWFRLEKKPVKNPIPDIFKRNNILTGSAHSVLKMLPLLDSVEDQKHSAATLFALHGSQPRAAMTLAVPDFVQNWPTLPSDPLLASFNLPQKPVDISGETTEADDANRDSILAFSDDQGFMHTFLDGTFPLDSVNHGQNSFLASLEKHPHRPLFFAHSAIYHDSGQLTSINPTIVEMSLLQDRRMRDFAELSTTAHQLMWHTARLMKELKEAWMGTETAPGVRTVGSIWAAAIEAKQREQFGLEDQSALLDLTKLLLNGRATDPLQDFLLASEHMSERSIQKWDTSMTDTLSNLRDYSEKRIAPCLQRLHVVLEEIKGWSQIPENAIFNFSYDSIQECIVMTHRGIIVASWLGSVARQELFRFREFMAWLRYEIVSVNPSSSEHSNTPVHDILEVNNYLTSGLLSSEIDKWFTGQAPSFKPSSLDAPPSELSLKEIVKLAKDALAIPHFTAWPPIPAQKDIDEEDRNLDLLVHQLGAACQQIFDTGSRAAGRSAKVAASPPPSRVPNAPPLSSRVSIRDRMVCLNPELDEIQQHYILRLGNPGATHFCYCRKMCSKSSTVSTFEYSIGAFYKWNESGEAVEILDMDFFDDENLLILYREEIGSSARGYIGLGSIPTVFHTVNASQHGTWEDFIVNVINKVATVGSKDLPSEVHSIWCRRRLHGCDYGMPMMAVNGTRKFAAVLDSKGLTLECIDLEVEVVTEEAGDEDETNE